MAEIKIYGTLVNDTNEAIVKSTQVAAVKQDGTAATQSAVNADLYAKYAAVGNAYRVKGTKATIAEVTALTTKAIGDVWNVTAEFTLADKKYPAGTNVVWTGSEWDPLGGTVDLAAVEGKLPKYFGCRSDGTPNNGYYYDFTLQSGDRSITLTTSMPRASETRDGFMASSQAVKLDGIAEGAQVNVIESVKVNNKALSVTSKAVNLFLPSSFDSIYTANSVSLQGVADQSPTPGYKMVIAAATQSAAGVMSSTDKSKLDGIAAGAQVNVLESVKVNGTALSVSEKSVNIDLSPYAKSADTIHVADVTASETNMNLKLRKKANDTPICNVVFNAATTSTAGLMSAADKQRLDDAASADNLEATNQVINALGASINALKTRVAALEAALTLK